MRRALFFGMILLIINSCGVLRPKPTSTLSVSNSKELLKQTQLTQPTWKTLDLRGSLTARQGDISQRITTTIRNQCKRVDLAKCRGNRTAGTCEN
jgi:hypothetical protein